MCTYAILHLFVTKKAKKLNAYRPHAKTGTARIAEHRNAERVERPECRTGWNAECPKCRMPNARYAECPVPNARNADRVFRPEC